MSNNSYFNSSPQGNMDYIPFNNSSSPNDNNRGNRNNRRNFRRGYNNRGDEQNNSFRPNFSPYNRGGGQRNFNRGRNGSFDNNNIAAYYHPSMLEDPWARLEHQLCTNKTLKASHSNTKSADNTCLDINNSSVNISKSISNPGSPQSETT